MNTTAKAKDMLERAGRALDERDWLRCAQLLLGAVKLIEGIYDEETANVCTHASGQEPWRE